MALDIEVPAVGPESAQVVFVGEAPASEEFIAKTPFVGDAGRRLRNYCKYAGLDLGPVRITNVCKERAPGYKIEKMPESRRRLWQEDFIKEINDLPNPRVILALGNFATQTLTSRTGITKLRGSMMHPVEEIKHDCVVIPTFHPASIGYGNYENWIYIVADLVRVKRLMDANCEFEFPTFNFIIKPDIQQVITTLCWMESHPELMYVLDVETPRGVLSCIGIGWSKSDAICIPFCYGDGRPYWTLEEEVLVWEILGRVLPKLNIHNQTWMFDWEILLEHHIQLKIPTWDPMMMHHCLYPTMKHSLDVITSLYTDIEYYKSDTRDEEGVKGSSLRSGFEREHWTYNCLDEVAAWWAIEELKKELVEENMMQVYQSLYVEMYEIFFRMNLTGAPIDMENLEKHREILLKENEGLASQLDALYKETIVVNLMKKVGTEHSDPKLELEASQQEFKTQYDEMTKKSFLPNSPKMVKELFLTHMGLTGYKDRRTGNISMSKEHLEKMSHKYKIEAPLWIVKYRSNVKELSLFSEENVPEGRIHTRYSPRTDTGRLSARKGIRGTGMNLQNVKNGETRRFFVAEKGEILLSADQKQAEAKVVAWLSKDKRMIEVAESGRLHLRNMEILFGIEGDKKDPRYRIAKALVHGANYGIREYQFGLEAGMLTSEAREYLALYHSTYPGIREVFHAFVTEEISTKRLLYNPFGRRMTFFGQLGYDTFKSGFSFIPQSTVTDINKKALKRLSKFKLPILDTHDGILLSVPKNCIQEGIEALIDAYDVEFEIWGQKHKIDIEVTTGENWYEMEEINLDTLSKQKETKCGGSVGDGSENTQKTTS